MQQSSNFELQGGRERNKARASWKKAHAISLDSYTQHKNCSHPYQLVHYNLRHIAYWFSLGNWEHNLLLKKVTITDREINLPTFFILDEVCMRTGIWGQVQSAQSFIKLEFHPILLDKSSCEKKNSETGPANELVLNFPRPIFRFCSSWNDSPRNPLNSIKKIHQTVNSMFNFSWTVPDVKKNRADNVCKLIHGSVLFCETLRRDFF